MTRAELPPTLPADHPDYVRERFTVKQAALYLDIKAWHVYAEMAAGRLGYRRDTPRRLRLSQADLDAWRASKRVDVLREPVRVPRHRAAAIRALKPLELPAVRRFS